MPIVPGQHFADNSLDLFDKKPVRLIPRHYLAADEMCNKFKVAVEIWDLGDLFFGQPLAAKQDVKKARRAGVGNAKYDLSGFEVENALLFLIGQAQRTAQPGLDDLGDQLGKRMRKEIAVKFEFGLRGHFDLRGREGGPNEPLQ